MLRYVTSTAICYNFSVIPKLQQHFPNVQHQSKWKNNHKRLLLISFVIQRGISCHFLLFCFNSLQIRNKNSRGKSPPWILALAFFKQREEELTGFACQVATWLFHSFWVSTPLGLRQLENHEWWVLSSADAALAPWKTGCDMTRGSILGRQCWDP